MAKKKEDELELINLKVSSKDRAALQDRADRHARGNLSAFLRHAGLRYIPSKDAVIKPYSKKKTA